MIRTILLLTDILRIIGKREVPIPPRMTAFSNPNGDLLAACSGRTSKTPTRYHCCARVAIQLFRFSHAMNLEPLSPYSTFRSPVSS